MGAAQEKGNNTTEMSSLNSDIQNQYDEFIETSHCCGIEIKKVVKNKLIWEENLKKNCQQLTKFYAWPEELIQLASTKKMSRKKYLNDFNDLKYQQKQPLPQEKEILLSPSEIDEFKKNLKKSVLLSYGQALKPSRPKEGSKIQSVIINSSKNGSRLKSDFRKSTIMQKQKIMRQSYKSGLRESIMTFVDDTMSSIFRSHEKDISKQSAHSLEVFIRFTLMLERHLNDFENKINSMILCFHEFVYRNFKKENVNPFEMEFLVNNIKVFLALLRDMVEDFYNTTSFAEGEYANFLISNDENLLAIVTAVFFKDEKIYQHIFGIVKQFNRERENKFQQIVQRLQGRPPQFFQIKKQYCLNQLTVKKYIEQMSSIESNLQNFALDELESVSEQPYLKCSESLKGLHTTKTPIAKMKMIMECSEKITLCVSQFYANNQMDVKNQMLDADQILSIFCYVVSIAKIEDLHSHLFMIEHFATDHQLISVTGYYYSVLTCALEQIENAYSTATLSEEG